MTEAEWLTCSQPSSMLAFLRRDVSDRKLRLFACACCQGIAGCLVDETIALLAVAERFADGAASSLERKGAREKALNAGWHPDEITKNARGSAKTSVFWTLARKAYEAATETSRIAASVAVQLRANRLVAEPTDVPADWTAWREPIEAEERASHAQMLRCIIGNPFRVSTLRANWQTPDVFSVARTVYDDRPAPSARLDSVRLSILADALEDAGCDDAAILAHCRDGGIHVRGCWVLDLILGRT